MNIHSHFAARVILPLTVAALPIVLLLSSVRTFNEIEEQKSIYLRHRVGLLAARLENMPAAASPEEIVESLSQDEPNLAGLQIILRGAAGDTPALEPIWSGGELFHTELGSTGLGQVFRAYVPFHSGAGLRIARIELAGSAADFLVIHARHNVIVSSVAGLVVVALSIVAVWAVRRAERMRLSQIQLEHLAHIGQMSASLAHEIRNPLGTIKGFVQLAGEGTDERTRQLLAPALAETQRLESLVNDLLAYGRPPHPNPKPVLWNEVLGGLAIHGRQLIDSRPIRLIMPEADFALYTDAALLGQALLNLLRNAVEAIPAEAEGEVRVEAAFEGAAGVAIVVADDGDGISDGALARLFEPFFTTKSLGTGLGLAITRKLVASLGGRLEVGRRQGRGTQAAIRLPHARREVPATAG